MEKAISLDQREIMGLSQIEQERTQALAAVGALSLDMENARKNLDSILGRQKNFIMMVLSNRGIDRYESARLIGREIIVNLPEIVPTDINQVIEKPNGLAVQE